MNPIASFLLLVVLALPASADNYIAVNAAGWVDATPDMLTLSVSARATGKDVPALQRQVDTLVQRVVTAAGKSGIAEEDIDSSRLSVRPEYQWVDGKRNYLGQTVQREVVMVLRELDRYGGLMEALSRFDLEEVRPPQLGHSQLKELELQALEAALANGFVKARRIATGIDADLGDVLRVEEQGTAPGQPMARMMAAESAGAGGPQVQFGKQRISTTVSMRFAIR